MACRTYWATTRKRCKKAQLRPCEQPKVAAAAAGDLVGLRLLRHDGHDAEDAAPLAGGAAVGRVVVGDELWCRTHTEQRGDDVSEANAHGKSKRCAAAARTSLPWGLSDTAHCGM